MNRTTVGSNQKSSIAGSIFQATEKTLEVPPKGQVHKIISTYIEEQGNIEISVGNSVVKENGEMQMKDGTIVAKMDSSNFAIISNYQKVRNEQKRKIAERTAKVSSER